MATARERAKIASDEALRRKTATPGLSRTNSTASRTVTRAPGPTLSKPPTRPTDPTRLRPSSRVQNEDGNTRPAAANAATSRPSSRRAVDSASATSQGLTRATKPAPEIDPVRNKENHPLSSPIDPPSDLTASVNQDTSSSKPTPINSLAFPSKKSPRKIEVRSINHSPRSSVSISEPSRREPSAALDRKPLADIHAENVGDQQVREVKITSDLRRETQRREGLERDLAALQNDMKRIEGEKEKAVEEALATARAEADEALQSQGSEHVKLVESLRQQLSAYELESKSSTAAKAQYETQITSLQAEIEALHNNPSKLKAVGKKIAEVEAALQESRSTASELQNGLNEEISKSQKDKIELAQTIEELKVEIDRAQKQLDDESAKQRKEKEAALRVTDGLRKELRDVKAANESEKKVLQDKADAATKLSAELQEKLDRRDLQPDLTGKVAALESDKLELQKLLDESKQELSRANDAHESTHQQLENSLRLAEDQVAKSNEAHSAVESSLIAKHQEAEQSVRSLQNELKDLWDAMAADQERIQSDSQAAADRISELQNTISELKQTGSKDGQLVSELQEQLTALRAENGEQAAKQEAELKGVASMTEKLQEELDKYEEINQRLKKEKSELVSSSRQIEEERLKEADNFKAEIRRLREEVQHKDASGAEQLEKAQKDAQGLNEEIEKVSHDKEQALVKIGTLETALAEQKLSGAQEADKAQEELRALQQRYEVLAKEHESNSHASQEAEALKVELDQLRQDALSESSANADLLKAMRDKDVELETLRASAKDSDAKISAHRAEFLDIQATLEATISDLRVQFQSLEAKHADELKLTTEKLKEDNLKVLRIKDSELVTLRDWVSGSENAVSQVVQLKEEKLSLEKSVVDLQQQVSELNSTQAAALESAKQDLQARQNLDTEALRLSHEEELSRMKTAHDSALATLEASARSENEALKSQQTSLQEQIKHLLASQASTSTHDSDLQALKGALATAQADSAETLAKLTHNHETQLNDLQAEFKQQQALLASQHAAETQDLRDKLRTLSNTPAPALVVAELSSRIADLEIALSTARADADRAIAEKQALLALPAPRSIASRSSARSGEDPFVDGEGTVEGTLASIAEQVRALEELNESFGTPRGRRSSAFTASKE